MAQTRAATNKAIRQEALREQLAGQGHVQHVVEIARKLNDQVLSLESSHIQAYKAAADIHLKLINKYLPDLKSTELTGADGGDIAVSHSIFEFIPVGNAKT